MRILIINSILRTPEGNKVIPPRRLQDCYVYRFARAFAALGHCVTLVAAEEYRPLESEPDSGHAPVETVFFRSLWPRLLHPGYLPVHPGLVGFLRRRGAEFDLIVSSEVFQVSSLMAALICPRRTVCWHEMICHQRRLFTLPARFWYNVVARLFMRHVRVVPRSPRADRFIRRYLPDVSPGYVTHGVDLDRFPVQRRKERRFAVVARFVPHKRVDRTIAAFAELVRDDAYRDFVLDIFGMGELEPELRAQCRELGVAGQVIFHGQQPFETVVESLGRTMGLLTSTQRDQVLLSIPEALACGTPVLTTTVPDMASDVERWGAGLVLDGWGASELRFLVEHNAQLVERAVACREELSMRHLAGLLLEQAGRAVRPGAV